MIARVTQKRPSFDSGTCIGSGRLEEMAEICRNENIDRIVFDCELTATQIRNIEDVCGVFTIDRTMLILDIFAQRATTREGRLQVEIAQNKYRLPRLAGMGTNMSRLGGGIGTRGPGESKLETDKRHIRTRIAALSDELKEIEKRRGLMRKRRKKDGVLTAAIVGYTNVGKSTLLNYLTEADVCDASADDCEEQAKVTLELLKELGCEGIPVVTVFNKCDKVPYINELDTSGEAVKISAKNGTGIDSLLAAIQKALPENSVRCRLLLPFDKAGFVNTIRQEGRIFSEDYTAEGIVLDALVDIKVYHLVESYKVKNEE